MVSVGFSSWSIGGVVGKADAQITINAEDVADINTYIRYSSDAEIFNYCKDGVISDGVIVSNADAIVNFEIALNDSSDQILNHMPKDSSSISIKTEFMTSYVSFLGTYIQSVSMSISDIGYSNDFSYSSSNNTNDGKTYTSNFSSSSGLNSSHLYFRVKYSFVFPVGDAFNTNVYTKMANGTLLFVFKAALS